MAERSFTKEVQQLLAEPGTVFHGEGILAVTKAMMFAVGREVKEENLLYSSALVLGCLAATAGVTQSRSYMEPGNGQASSGSAGRMMAP